MKIGKNNTQVLVISFVIELKRPSDKNLERVIKLMGDLWDTNKYNIKKNKENNFAQIKPEWEVTDMNHIVPTKFMGAQCRFDYKQTLFFIFKEGGWIKDRKILLELKKLIKEIEFDFIEGTDKYATREKGKLEPATDKDQNLDYYVFFKFTEYNCKILGYEKKLIK